MSDPAEVDLIFTLPSSISLILIIFVWYSAEPTADAISIGLLNTTSTSFGDYLHGAE